MAHGRGVGDCIGDRGAPARADTAALSLDSNNISQVFCEAPSIGFDPDAPEMRPPRYFVCRIVVNGVDLSHEHLRLACPSH